MTKIIIIVGPTAVGKTQLGITLAQRFNGEIISGDSMQVYRKLDIGTAKASAEEQKQAVHHLIDIKNVSEGFSAYDFVVLATEKIREISDKGLIPIIVGGTGLYIQALTEGYHLGGRENHVKIQKLQSELENSQVSDEKLWEELSSLDNESAKEIPIQNRRRVARKIALAKFNQSENNLKPDFEFKIIGLNTKREDLYQRINQRVDIMAEAGLLAEARWLKEKYPTAQAVQAIGYKEFFPYLDGTIGFEEAIELVKRNSRRYAKRQLTWFRNRMNVEFWDLFNHPDELTAVEKEIEEWL